MPLSCAIINNEWLSSVWLTMPTVNTKFWTHTQLPINCHQLAAVLCATYEILAYDTYLLAEINTIFNAVLLEPSIIIIDYLALPFTNAWVGWVVNGSYPQKI